MISRKRIFGENTPQPTVSGGSDAELQPIEFQWGVRIPMRDGLALNATIYRPKDGPPVPAIFTLTPYIADSYHARSYYFAKNSFAFALVDCRGRGNSDGEFEPFVNEGRDGHDVVEWLAAQPWCDGQVTMWGGSYGGFDQWMALKEFPPHLKTIAPVASAHAAVDFPFYKNIFYPYEMQWLSLISGNTGNANLFAEDQFWIDKFQEWYRAGRPFNELDQIVGNGATVYQKWLQHPAPDAYWQTMWLSPAEYARIDLPILTITGHYDGDQPGAIHFYRQHMQHGSENAIQNHFLVIGPWDHAGTRTPKTEFGGLKFGDASLVDINKLHKEWYEWTLKGGSRPEFLKDRVVYYVAGSEMWKSAPDVASIAADTRVFYLNSENGRANDAFHSGSLDDSAPTDSQPDGYTYDPLDLRMADLETRYVEDYLTDERYELHLFGAGLVYHTAPFTEEIEISGWARLAVWLALDVPDTDFRALLSVIGPDGRHILLAEDVLRARYRKSVTEESLVEPGVIEEYVFDGFPFFSRLIAKGSWLRLVLRAPNTIFLQKNYNSGGVVSNESAADARTAHVTLYHDAAHPSRLELPHNRSQTQG